MSHYKDYEVTIVEDGKIAKRKVRGEKVIIPQLEDYNFFVHRMVGIEDYFVIFEVESGLKFPLEGKTKKEAFDSVVDFIRIRGRASFLKAKRQGESHIKRGEIWGI